MSSCYVLVCPKLAIFVCLFNSKNVKSFEPDCLRALEQHPMSNIHVKCLLKILRMLYIILILCMYVSPVVRWVSL